MNSNQEEASSLKSDSLKSKKIRKLTQTQNNRKRKKEALKITHYFCRHEAEAPAPNKVSKLPTPDKAYLFELEQEEGSLSSQEVQLVQAIERLKDEQLRMSQESSLYIKKARTLIVSELKKLYELKRLAKGSPAFEGGILKGSRSSKRSVEEDHFSSLISQKSALADHATGDQKYFLKSEVEELRKQLQYLQMRNEQRKEQSRLVKEEETCLMAREGWPIFARKYQPLQLIGKGGFSQVYKGYNIATHAQVALKISNIELLTNNSAVRAEYLRHINRECEMHKLLKHPNIAQLIQMVEIDDNHVCLALQYCEGPQLSRYLKQKGRLTEYEAKAIVFQLVSALNYLQEQPRRIIHYDLKPQNIVFHQGCIKILDFGLCKALEGEHSRMALTSQGAGTYWYLPPETFNQKNPTVSAKVDVWSVGVIFYELLSGLRPYGHGMSQRKILKAGTILNAQAVEFPDDVQVSQEGKHFLQGCLEINEQRRLDPAEAYSHEYFKDYR